MSSARRCTPESPPRARSRARSSGERAAAERDAARGVGVGAAEADPVRRPARAHHVLVRRVPDEPADGGRRRRPSGRGRVRLRAPLLGARLLVDQRPRPHAHAARVEARRSSRSASATRSPRTRAARHGRLSRLGVDPGRRDARRPLGTQERDPARPRRRARSRPARSPRRSARRRRRALPPSPLLLGLLALGDYSGGGADFARYISASSGVPTVPAGVPVRDLPADCREFARDAGGAVREAREWNVPSIVIPHGTTWGFYTPLGSSWDKQLTPEQHDPGQQRLIEVFSGHGNSEEFRPYREVVIGADGARTLPRARRQLSARRAGARARSSRRAAAPRETAGGGVRRARGDRAAELRRRGATTAAPPPCRAPSSLDWQDAGQCRDCFQPAFNYRPRSSVQYIMSLEQPSGTRRRCASGSASSRRATTTPAGPAPATRRWRAPSSPRRASATSSRRRSASRASAPPLAQSEPYQPDTGRLAVRRVRDRAAGLVLPERRARGGARDRPQPRRDLGRAPTQGSVWHERPAHPALVRPAERAGRDAAADGQRGRAARRADLPGARGRLVRAEARLSRPMRSTRSARARERLCQGECYHPSDRRRPITRIEVVRIRPGAGPGRRASGSRIRGA